MKVKEKPTVLIFGGSEGGENFINKQTEYNILAIIDNDEGKVGKMLYGIPIIAPSNIMSFDYDNIIVTSMYFNPIEKQLIDLGIEPKKIIAAPKRLLKKVVNPFQDEITLNFALESIKKLVQFFERNSIRYFADFGTLLGIVREGNLILWDDDIDLSITSDHLEKLKFNLENFLIELSSEVRWYYKYIYNENKKVSSIVLAFEDENNLGIKPFTIDLWVIYFKDGYASQTMNKCDEAHFKGNDLFKFKDYYIRVPNNYTTYLEHTYGDWKTPKKDVTFADYPFAFIE